MNDLFLTQAINQANLCNIRKANIWFNLEEVYKKRTIYMHMRCHLHTKPLSIARIKRLFNFHLLAPPFNASDDIYVIQAISRSFIIAGERNE